MKTRCPHCGQPAVVRRNPFYGTGLAVHEHLVDCEKCLRVSFLPNAVDPTPAAAAPRRQRGVGSAIRTVFARFAR